MAASDDGVSRITLATLDAKVGSLDRDYDELKRAVTNLDAKIDSSIAGLANRFEAAITGLHGKLDARSTTPWATIWSGLGVGFTVIIAIGTALYLPIQRDTSRLDATMAAVLDRGVYQREYTADQTRLTALLNSLRADLNITIQQQRYNADQEKLNKVLDEARSRATESYGQIAKLEDDNVNTTKRVDAISARLAQFIREGK